MYHNKQLKHQNVMLDLLSAMVPEGLTSHWANALLFETERKINKEICKAFMLLWSLTAEVTNILILKNRWKRCLNIYQLDRLLIILLFPAITYCSTTRLRISGHIPGSNTRIQNFWEGPNWNVTSFLFQLHKNYHSNRHFWHFWWTMETIWALPSFSIALLPEDI